MKKYFVHKSSYVDEGCSIGKNTKIWHFSHIMTGAIIGKNCSIGQNVNIGPKAIVGNNCKIQNNVSVYDNVTIEDNVFCGPSMVFTNVINPRSEVDRKNEYMNTLVKKGATLGANCTIVCGVSIGSYSFIGAGAVICKNIPNYALYVGNPAKQIGWMCEYGNRLDLPLSGNGETICHHTGDKYVLINGICSRNINDEFLK
ncbi:MAG TPA: DapH/DapD/GlmU-related protein [Victivallales bacterium]|nr:DapH/DapD/GlmU-related protein [Victivallales bacterium]|tara:strand:+ start:26 stop:625 length:600 start_codon:yes stop_codon:yes gene_type:complete